MEMEILSTGHLRRSVYIVLRITPALITNKLWNHTELLE